MIHLKTAQHYLKYCPDTEEAYSLLICSQRNGCLSCQQSLALVSLSLRTMVDIVVLGIWRLLWSRPDVCWCILWAIIWLCPTFNYRQTSNLSRNLVGNKLVDHWDVVGTTVCRCCSNYIFIIDLTPDFRGLDNDNCKSTRKSVQFCDFVQLILEILRYNQLVNEAPARNVSSSESVHLIRVW